LFFPIVRAVINFLLGLISTREYVGLENIPSEPPYILATNHISIFDIPFLASVCPHTIRAFAAAKHKRNLIYAPILALAGGIWVRRGAVDRSALSEALAVLERGEVLGIAPEGTRARGPYALQKGKTGTAYLAARANVPIVPVGLTGTEKVKDNLLHLRCSRLRAVVGKPFRLPEGGALKREKLAEYTKMIMRRIAELLPQDYRGVYT